MARDALSNVDTTAGISSYQKGKANEKSAAKTTCKSCRARIDKYLWNRRQKKNIECTLCLSCGRKSNLKKDKAPKDETPKMKQVLLFSLVELLQSQQFQILSHLASAHIEEKVRLCWIITFSIPTKNGRKQNLCHIQS